MQAGACSTPELCHAAAPVCCEVVGALQKPHRAQQAWHYSRWPSTCLSCLEVFIEGQVDVNQVSLSSSAAPTGRQAGVACREHVGARLTAACWQPGSTHVDSSTSAALCSPLTTTVLMAPATAGAAVSSLRPVGSSAKLGKSLAMSRDALAWWASSTGMGWVVPAGYMFLPWVSTTQLQVSLIAALLPKRWSSKWARGLGSWRWWAR